METSHLERLCWDVQRMVMEMIFPELVPLPGDNKRQNDVELGDDSTVRLQEVHLRFCLALAYYQIIRPRQPATLESLLVSVWGPTIRFYNTIGTVAKELLKINMSQEPLYGLIAYAQWGFLEQYVRMRQALAVRLADPETEQELKDHLSAEVLHHGMISNDIILFLFRRGEIEVDISDAIRLNSPPLAELIQQSPSFQETKLISASSGDNRFDYLIRYVGQAKFTTPAGFLILAHSQYLCEFDLFHAFEAKIDYHVQDDKLNNSEILLHILGLMSYQENIETARFEIMFRFLQKYWGQLVVSLVNPGYTLHTAIQLSLRRAQVRKTISNWFNLPTQLNPRVDVLLFLYDQLFQVPFDSVRLQAQLRQLTDTSFWVDMKSSVAGWVQIAISQGQMKANPWLKKQGLC